MIKNSNLESNSRKTSNMNVNTKSVITRILEMMKKINKLKRDRTK